MTSILAQFNYQVSGPENGRKWVFLHGLMGFGQNWRRIVQMLGPNECVLTFDQRGHGKSVKPVVGYRPEDYAEDVLQITEALGWNKFILVGHSMGGRNALVFADLYPHKLEKLVIVDIGPEAKPAALDYFRNLLGLVPTPFASKKEAKEFLMNEFPKRAAHLAQPETLGAYFYANIIELENGQADWRFSKEAILESVAAGRAQDHWSEIKTLKMPTLIIRGENSPDLSAETLQHMAQSNPRIQTRVISGAAHWVHTDQPEAFVRALKEFTE